MILNIFKLLAKLLAFYSATTDTYEIVEILVYTNFNFFLQNYQNQGQSTEGRKKKE